jgi:23S rRNA-/tRNA-specific pseudouridylate synthase
VPVFPPHADPGGDCVLKRLLAEDPARAALPWPVGFEGGIAHRLDTSTSGALAVADDLAELDRLRALFHGRELVKTYLFETGRAVPWHENRCDRALGHDPRHKGRMIVQRGPSTPCRGRWMPATTSFRRLSGRCWEATMSTGVMHQIRAHAAFLGIPVLGDRRYGGGPAVDGGFHLHHRGFTGPGDLRTDPVPDPLWAPA